MVSPLAPFFTDPVIVPAFWAIALIAVKANAQKRLKRVNNLVINNCFYLNCISKYQIVSKSEKIIKILLKFLFS